MNVKQKCEKILDRCITDDKIKKAFEGLKLE